MPSKNELLHIKYADIFVSVLTGASRCVTVRHGAARAVLKNLFILHPQRANIWVSFELSHVHFYLHIQSHRRVYTCSRQWCTLDLFVPEPEISVLLVGHGFDWPEKILLLPDRNRAFDEEPKQIALPTARQSLFVPMTRFIFLFEQSRFNYRLKVLIKRKSSNFMQIFIF